MVCGSFLCLHNNSLSPCLPLQEIKELESRIQNKTVVLQDNTRRSLDMDQFIKAVENQYATMATRTREEAEQWNQRKVFFYDCLYDIQSYCRCFEYLTSLFPL